MKKHIANQLQKTDMKHTGTLTLRDSRYRENFLKKMLNNLLAGILKLLSLLPFRLIYLISDGLCFLLRNILKYRKGVIYGNLRHAFPQKTEKEIKTIAGKYYRHLTDLMMETVKMYSMENKHMDERLSVKGMDLIEKFFHEGRSIIILAMHHNNWEWCSSLQTKGKHLLLMLYNPVRGNQAMEKYILHAREKWGGKCIPVHKSARAVMDYHQRGIPTALWLGADQTPPATSKFWTVFLNREAPFFTGPEKIAAKTNQPVFFQHIKKTGRGRYETDFSLLSDNPAGEDADEILLRYVQKMEEVIREEPEYYLWSHRRWKHQRPEGTPLTTKKE